MNSVANGGSPCSASASAVAVAAFDSARITQALAATANDDPEEHALIGRLMLRALYRKPALRVQLIEEACRFYKVKGAWQNVATCLDAALCK